jgi:hypothetical protein
MAAFSDLGDAAMKKQKKTKKRFRKRFHMIEAGLWASDAFQRLTPAPPCATLLFFYLRTGPHVTPLPGLWHVGEAALAEGLDWSLEDFRRCFAELEVAGLVQGDFRARLIWMPAVFQLNFPDSFTVVMSWANLWRDLPACPLKRQAAEFIRSAFMADESKGKHLEEFQKFAAIDLAWAAPQDRHAYPPPDGPKEGGQDGVQGGRVYPPTEGLPVPSGTGSLLPCRGHINRDLNINREKDLFPPSGGAGASGAVLSTSPSRKPKQPAPELTPSGFPDFWAAYPKRVKKTRAQKAWSKLAPDADLVRTILSALEWQAGSAEWKREAGRFVPHPATWLNDRRWEDQPPEPAGSSFDAALRDLVSEGGEG